VKNPDPKDLALSYPQSGFVGPFLGVRIHWSNGVVELWSNDKDLLMLRFRL
jgi:hypothetical protein